MAQLRPANENPWYVLMTLFQDKTGRRPTDWPSSDWNAWIVQAIDVDLLKNETEYDLHRRQIGDLRSWRQRSKEIEDRFHRVWRNLNGALRLPDLPSPNDIHDLSGTLFHQDVSFRYFVFGAANFSGSIFRGKVEINNAIFVNGTADFGSVIFEKSLSASRTTFRGGAVFGRSHFNSGAGIQGSRFLDVADFENTEFSGSVLFGDTKFRNFLYFRQSTFLEAVSFKDLSVEQNADFERTKFSGNVSFWHSDFRNGVGLLEADFGARFNFRNCEVIGNFDCENSAFHDYAYFDSSAFGQRRSFPCVPSFKNAIFERPTSFRGAKFSTHFPVMSGAILHEQTLISAQANLWPSPAPQTIFDADWWLLPLQEYGEARESCAILRHVVARQSLPEEASFFFGHEMCLATKMAKWDNWLFYWLYWLLSEYGNAIWRPLIWLLVLTCASAYWLASVPLPNCPAPFEHAASNALSFLGYLRSYYPDCAASLTPGLKALSGLQTVLSVILLFFLGLGLRARFRLR